MRDGYAADTAAPINFGCCLVIEQGDAIPEQISSGRLQKQSALAYGEFWFGADSQKPRRFLFEAVPIIGLESFQGCPFLASVTHELPFIFANWTAQRRFRAFSKLRPALHADKIFHRENV
jgi:hypothetical protein